MEKLYKKIGWKNKPNLATPLGASNLKKIDEALDGLDNRTIELDNKDAEQGRHIEGLYAETRKNTQAIESGFDALKIAPTASGSPVYIFDASNMGFEGIDFFGESKQMQTTGKNLLQNTGKDIERIGLTYTMQSDGSVKVVGTTTEADYQVLIGQVTLPKGSYILSGAPNSICRLRIAKGDNSTLLGHDLGSGFSFTLEEQSTVFVSVRTQSTVGTNINAVYYPMIRLASITDSTWEKYTGGKASPNPDYPQPIESSSVGSVSVRGKNLMQNTATTLTKDGITFTVNKDGSVTANGTATAQTYFVVLGGNKGRESFLGKEIILSGCPNGGGADKYYLQFYHYDKNNNNALDYGSGTKLTFTNDTADFNVSIIVKSGVTMNNVKFYPMIRPSFFTDATYEPYQSQTVSFSAPIELNGIGGVRDTDKLKEFGVVVLDGSNDEGWYTMDTQTAGVKRIYTRTFKVKNSASIYTPANNILCSHYKPISASDTYLQKQGIATTTADNYIYIYDERFNTADISLWKAHLASNPITLVYELETPEETALPKADADAIKALHSYKPNTVVMNDADAEMDVHYVADAKTYIDKKFEALASAIVNQ